MRAHWRYPLAAITSIAMALGGTVFAASPASAATTLYVAHDGDDSSNNCQDSAHPCATLAHALHEANSDDTIKVTGTLHETGIDVPSDLTPITITGAGASSPAVIDGGGANETVLTVPKGVTANLDHLAITGASGGSVGITGGGINNQGGTVTVAHSIISGNHAGQGAAINNQTGSLKVIRSTVADNTDTSGGAIYSNNGDVTITDSTISRNKADSNGGGIEHDIGTLTVTGSTIANNEAQYSGGGIYAQRSPSPVTVTKSTISGNTAGGSGGGIYAESALTVTTSTIAHNKVSRYNGGGIYEYPGSVITASTISGNTAPADEGGGGGIYNATNINAPTPATKLGATIVAGNSEGNCTGQDSGTFASEGYNLTNDATGTDCGFSTGDHDLIGTSPELGELADNGGPNAPDTPTKTMLPARTSPAARHIPDPPVTINGVPVCGGGAAYDQRGVPRPTPPFTTCTVGAVEVTSQPPVITSDDHTTFTAGHHGTFTVTTTGAYPGPVTLTVRGFIPAGLTFHDNGDGTGTFTGTPAPGTGGHYHLVITAANGAHPDAVQDFTLTVNEAPAITSPGHATFTDTRHGAFTVTTAGYPTPKLTLTGHLPPGVTFRDNGDGTATLSGTPARCTSGTYHFTITAANGVKPDAVQHFTLTVTKTPGAPGRPPGKPGAPSCPPGQPAPPVVPITG